VIRGSRTGSTGLEDKVEDVVAALQGFAGTLNSVGYMDISQQGDVLWLGRDENENPVYALNWTAHREDGPELLFAYRVTTHESFPDGVSFTRATTTSAPASYANSSES